MCYITLLQVFIKIYQIYIYYIQYNNLWSQFKFDTFTLQDCSVQLLQPHLRHILDSLIRFSQGHQSPQTF